MGAKSVFSFFVYVMMWMNENDFLISLYIKSSIRWRIKYDSHITRDISEKKKNENRRSDET
jgi:hypothetical protein